MDRTQLHLKACFTLLLCLGIVIMLLANQFLSIDESYVPLSLADKRPDPRWQKFCTCKNFTEEVWKGFWKEKHGITRKDYLDRKKMDEKIRFQMDWPINLFRNDSRCSAKYPIPGYRIQSLCVAESEKPCCNTKNGTCGNTAEHCKCSECTDFRDFKSAELLQWVTKNADCGIRNITTNEACNFFNKFKINLTFIGDSLIRQVFSMILILLSGDPLLGAMSTRASKAELEKCKGELQMVNKDCSIYLSARSSNETRNGSMCNGNYNFYIDNAQVYMNYITDEALEKATRLLGVENSYLVIGVGMHFHLHVWTVKQAFINRLLDLINKRGNGWPEIIWIGIHNVDGFLRVDTKFRNDNIQRFNHKVRNYLKEKNVTFIRTFEMSQNLRSYDGQHYGIGFNFYKVQMILNYLMRKYETG